MFDAIVTVQGDEATELLDAWDSGDDAFQTMMEEYDYSFEREYPVVESLPDGFRHSWGPYTAVVDARRGVVALFM